jgi:hypothetical protein
VIECKELAYQKPLFKRKGKKVADQKNGRDGDKIVYMPFSEEKAFPLRMDSVIKVSPVVCKNGDCLFDSLAVNIAADFYMPFVCAPPSLTRPNLIGGVFYNTKLRYLAGDDVSNLSDCDFR